MALCALVSFAVSANAVKVVFRLDDPTVQYDSVSNRILQLFISNDIPLSVVMVPCAKDEMPYEVNDSSYWQLLNSPNIEIAQHGLTHENIYNKGEFGGLSSEETNRRFQKGKSVLSRHFNKPIITFSPPFNSINPSFLTNLESNGFLILTADMYRDIPCKGHIQYYPETLGHLMKQPDIWTASRESIINCKEKNAICVIMFHAYDLPDSTAWQQLGDLLKLCKESENIELHTFSSLLSSGEHSNWLRYKSNQLQSGLSKKLLSKGVLHSTWLCLLIHTLNALLYMLIAVIGFLILLVYSQHIKTKRYFYCITAIIGIMIFCLAWLHILSPMKLLIVSLLINIIPIVYFIFSKKNHQV